MMLREKGGFKANSVNQVHWVEILRVQQGQHHLFIIKPIPHHQTAALAVTKLPLCPFN